MEYYALLCLAPIAVQLVATISAHIRQNAHNELIKQLRQHIRNDGECERKRDSD